MRIFKHKSFNRWAEKQGITDNDLKNAIDEIEQRGDFVRLGSNVYKKRVSIGGHGKIRHRTIILMKIGEKAIFVYGFNKSERDNIADNELRDFKYMAKTYLSLQDEKLNELLDRGMLIEVERND